MKFFKLGMAAVVALLAITFSIASQAGAFKSKLFANPVAGKCYSTVQTCANDVNCVVSVDPADEVDPAECPSGTTQICCFKITDPGVQCSAPCPTTGLKIQSIVRKLQ